MKRRKGRSVAIVAGALAITCAVMFWPSFQAWWEKRELVAMLREDVGAWNEWRKTESDRIIDLSGVDLRGMDLGGANLDSVDLSGANLDSVHFGSWIFSNNNVRLWRKESYTNLSGANFSRANLSRAVLKNTYNWESAVLKDANIFCVKNAPEGFIEVAKSQGAIEVPPKDDSTNLPTRRRAIAITCLVCLG